MNSPNDSLGVLFACPLCGGRKGYKLAEGNSFRWWVVNCAACGERVTECRSDMRTSAGEPLPAEWPAAAQCWNEAGSYANGLRKALEKIADWDSSYGPFPENNEAWRAMAVVTAREAVPLTHNTGVKGRRSVASDETGNAPASP